MASLSTLIRKLQSAINTRGGRILFQTTQFYSEEQDRPITVFHIKKAVFDEETGKKGSVELFHSCSQIQIVMYLKDIWEEMNK